MRYLTAWCGFWVWPRSRPTRSPPTPAAKIPITASASGRAMAEEGGVAGAATDPGEKSPIHTVYVLTSEATGKNAELKAVSQDRHHRQY